MTESKLLPATPPYEKAWVHNRVKAEIDEFVSKFIVDVSDEARAIIDLTLQSFFSRQAGAESLDDPEIRIIALDKGLNSLPLFLQLLRSEAAIRSHRVDSAPDPIGAYLVLRFIRKWEALSGCTCWPVDV